MEMRPLSPKDILRIIQRRRWWLTVPLVAVFLGSMAIAFILPPVYKSTSTILIEQQNIPPEYVKMADTSYAEQQLQMINQRIMTSAKLLQITNTFQLYPDLRRSNNTEGLIAKMREDIELQPISANITDPRTGRTNQSATIAFTLSYEGIGDPKKVQQVAKALAEFFLLENIQMRQRKATELTGFLDDEAKKMKTQIEQIDARIARFKEEHVNDLPELLQVNIEGMHDVQRAIDQATNKLAELKEKEGYLKTQLASTPPEFKETERKHLSELQVKLVELRNQFSEEHPDVVKTKTEIAMIEKRLQLAESKGTDKKRPDNPAYITLAAQFSSVQSEISSVNTQINDLNARLNEYKRNVSFSPQVESEYRSLVMERDNTRAKYDDLMRKFMESKMSQGLEEKQNWERFTLIDPARVPEAPFKPNRLAIILLGLALGAGTGVGAMSLREFTDDSVRDAHRLLETTSFPVLARIPVIINTRDQKKARVRTWLFIAVLIIGVIIAISVILILNMGCPLDLNTIGSRIRGYKI
jgi:succinoglycan biosynthesis transport protein ExoP